MRQLILNVSALSGNILTKKNLQDSNIELVSLDLAFLLVRPGYDFLLSLEEVSTYLQWQNFILSATSFVLDKNNNYTIKSVLDGKVYKYSYKELEALILKLKPEILVWPFSLSEEARKLFNQNNIKIVTEELACNKPIEDAMRGLFYEGSDIYSVLDENFTADLSLLANSCACMTCQQNFTRAYFVHLFQAVPMLCWRYLAIHNIFWLSKS